MKHMLLSTAAAGVLILFSGGLAKAQQTDTIEGSGNSQNQVQAVQTLGSGIAGSGVSVGFSEEEQTDPTFTTGDINYDGSTTTEEGVFTLQNQTGLNNAGNNGANVAAQVNDSGANDAVELSGSATNIVNAQQTMGSSITGSPVVVNTLITVDEAEMLSTGDVSYDATTFGGVGLYTLQNQTGFNNAGNNGSNIAAQYNEGSDSGVTAEDGSLNQVSATQSLTAGINTSNVTITNTSEVEDAPMHTGNITYSGTTFNAEGVYTLQNNTGLNVAANNGTNVAAQINVGDGDSIQLEDASRNLVLSNQAMSASIASSSVNIINDVDTSDPSYTGNINYAGNTFSAPGVFTISNNTGMNNAASNGLNVAVQWNGPVGSL